MVQLVIPMAGLGARFRDVGYQTRKPFILVDGRPMVRRVLETMRVPEESTVLVCLKEDEYRTRSVFPRATVVPIEYDPNGTACSVLHAVPYLNPDESVLVANSDQIVRWDPEAFYAATEQHGANGALLTFEETEGSPKWSFIEPGLLHPHVFRVVAKKAVSSIGVVGVYWYRTAEIMMNAITSMIDADDRTKGEFYLCPSFNYIGGAVIYVPCESMEGVGTPEDLDAYRRRHERCCFGKCARFDGHNCR